MDQIILREDPGWMWGWDTESSQESDSEPVTRDDSSAEEVSAMACELPTPRAARAPEGVEPIEDRDRSDAASAQFENAKRALETMHREYACAKVLEDVIDDVEYEARRPRNDADLESARLDKERWHQQTQRSLSELVVESFLRGEAREIAHEIRREAIAERNKAIAATYAAERLRSTVVSRTLDEMIEEVVDRCRRDFYSPLAEGRKRRRAAARRKRNHRRQKKKRNDGDFAHSKHRRSGTQRGQEQRASPTMALCDVR
jgi:hypothetical protein